MPTMDPTPEPMSRREWMLAAAGLWGVVVLLHGALAWGGAAAAGGDLVNQLLPMTVSWLRHGAGWAPGTFSGRPLFADPQSGILYPPNWLHLLMGESQVPRTTTILLVAHLVWAGLGMHAFVRKFTGAAGAAFAAATWIACGVYGARLSSGIAVFVTAGAWLPWVMWGIEGGRGEGTPALRRLGFLALFAAMQILAGAPQVVQVTWAGALAWSALRTGFGADRRSAGAWLHALGVPLAAFALGIVVALPQLAASAELAGLAAPRDGGDRWAFVTSDSLQLRQMVHWLFPDFYGAGNSAYYWGSASGFHDSTCWIGMPALVLAAFGVAVSAGTRRQLWWPCAVVAALSLALAFGRSSPLFRFAFEFIPTFDGFRVPARWIIWLGFMAVALAGIGLDALFSRAGNRADSRRWLASSLAVLLPCAAFLVALGPILWRVLDLSRGIADLGALAPPDAATTMATEARQAVVWGVAMAAATCVLGLAILAGRMKPAWALVALGVLSLVDARRFWTPFHSEFPTDVAQELVESIERHPRVGNPAKFASAFYPRTPLVEELQGRGGRYIFTDDVQGWFFDQNQREVQMESAHVTGLESARGYQQLIPRAYLEEIQRAGEPLRPGLRPVPFLSLERLRSRKPLDAYNVTSVLTYAALQDPADFLAMGLVEPRIMHPAGLVLLGNPRARGWAWVSSRETWLDAEPEPLVGQAQATSRNGGRELYRVRIQAAGGAWLHVSSPEYPGWEWTGLPEGARIASTRSVFLPPGEHRVGREFRVRHLGAGWLAVSLAGVLTALACIGFGGRPRKSA